MWMLFVRKSGGFVVGKQSKTASKLECSGSLEVPKFNSEMGIDEDIRASSEEFSVPSHVDIDKDKAYFCIVKLLEDSSEVCSTLSYIVNADVNCFDKLLGELVEESLKWFCNQREHKGIKE